MTVEVAMTMLAAGLVGFGVAGPLARLRLRAPPRWSVRTNVRGVKVPAVLGGPIVTGALAALAGTAFAGALGWGPARTGGVGPAVALVLVVMFLAGSWDDRRGDERERGFGGHLKAARGGRVTGGVVKLGAGAVCGLGAGALVTEGGDGWWPALASGAIVALAANLVNLTDRAPGRAGKVTLVAGAALMVWGGAAWAVTASGAFGALIACLALDLTEKGMLGDAGANPLGALLGVGLAGSVQGGSAAIAVVLLAVVNLASERWSFSEAIEKSPLLRAVDRFGRK